MSKYKFYVLLLLLSAGGLFFNPSVVSAKDCDATTAVPQKVTAVSGPKSGQVTLFWEASPQANRYAVVYGTMSNKYIYGARDIGGEAARSYTVSLLSPGVRYYFRMASARGCNSSPFAAEVSAVAAGGAAQVVSAPVVTTSVAPIVKTQPKAEAPVSVKMASSGVGKQQLRVVSGPKVGEVTLYWQHADNANNYHLVYGTTLEMNQYGALNLGNINKFTVRSLVLGKVYYFALVPLIDNRPLYTTQSVMGVAGGNEPEVVMTTKEALIMPIGKPVVQTSPSSTVSGAPSEIQPTAAAGQ